MRQFVIITRDAFRPQHKKYTSNEENKPFHKKTIENKLTWPVCFETKLQPDEDEDSTALPTQSSVSAM